MARTINKFEFSGEGYDRNIEDVNPVLTACLPEKPKFIWLLALESLLEHHYLENLLTHKCQL